MPRAAVVLIVALVAGTVSGPTAGQDRGRANYFDDPFIQVTSAIASCPVPAGPAVTFEEFKAQSHSRVERGTSCYRAGRCRLPNSYLYDKEIIPRVKIAILADGRFADTSLWAEGERRLVFLTGCVRSEDEAREIEKLVGAIDDVEGVIPRLQVVPR